MQFLVTSGDYSLKIEQKNHYQAAFTAIQLWQYKAKKPRLAAIITVLDNTNKKVYLSTPTLIESIIK